MFSCTLDALQKKRGLALLLLLFFLSPFKNSIKEKQVSGIEKGEDDKASADTNSVGR